ncbi:hypothetical protein Pfo_005378 [Paulownia fortunei]|nr:hypothetical protein Pfo_005378 [Paulownia fortunei]
MEYLERVSQELRDALLGSPECPSDSLECEEFEGQKASALTISTTVSHHVASLDETTWCSKATVKKSIKEVARHKWKIAKMTKSFKELKSKYDHKVKTKERFLQSQDGFNLLISREAATIEAFKAFETAHRLKIIQTAQRLGKQQKT